VAVLVKGRSGPVIAHAGSTDGPGDPGAAGHPVRDPGGTVPVWLDLTTHRRGGVTAGWSWSIPES